MSLGAKFHILIALMTHVFLARLEPPISTGLLFVIALVLIVSEVLD